MFDENFCFSTHPDIKNGEDIMGFTSITSASTTTTTTTASPEEGSGGGDTDDKNEAYWNVVYEAIVWIDALTVGWPKKYQTSLEFCIKNLKNYVCSILYTLYNS